MNKNELGNQIYNVYMKKRQVGQRTVAKGLYEQLAPKSTKIKTQKNAQAGTPMPATEVSTVGLDEKYFGSNTEPGGIPIDTHEHLAELPIKTRNELLLQYYKAGQVSANILIAMYNYNPENDDLQNVNSLMKNFVEKKQSLFQDNDNRRFHSFLQTIGYPEPWPSLESIRDFTYDGKNLEIIYEDDESGDREDSINETDGSGYRIYESGPIKLAYNSPSPKKSGRRNVRITTEEVPIDSVPGLSKSSFRINPNSSQLKS
jgi:hypothetical protein